jgi:hypothetical protein
MLMAQVDAFVVVHAGRAADESGLLSDLWSVKWQIPEERDVGGEYTLHKQGNKLMSLQESKCMLS